MKYLIGFGIGLIVGGILVGSENYHNTEFLTPCDRVGYQIHNGSAVYRNLALQEQRNLILSGDCK